MISKDNPGFSSILWGLKVLVERYLDNFSLPEDINEKIKSNEEIIKKACKLIYPNKDVWKKNSEACGLQPLKSIFSDIYFAEPYKSDKVYIYPRADFECIPYPEIKRGNPNLDDWKKKLSDDVKDVLNTDKSPELLLTLLQRHAVFLPAFDDEETSLPLFDFLKLAIAVVSCLGSDDLDETSPFILLAVDFSGVQDFVYTIASSSALKTLRARSFYLELLTHHLAYEFLDKFGLSSANIIYAGGGKFYLLLPNTTEIKNEIKESRKNLNKWLYDEFEGRLHLAIAWEEFENLSDISGNWRKLQNKVEKAKKRKFIDLFETSNLYEDDGIFDKKEPTQMASEDECQICHTDIKLTSPIRVKKGEDETKACEFCCDLINTGELLKNLKHYKHLICVDDSNLEKIDKSDKKARLKVPLINGDCAHYIMSSQKDIKSLYREMPKIRKFIVNKPDQILSDFPDSLLMFAETYVTLEDKKDEDKDSADFDQLAKMSIGTDLLGALRLDVDNLGLIFSKEDQLTHLSALSRNLDYFFKFYLNLICDGELLGDKRDDSVIPSVDICEVHTSDHSRKVSIIYSGGDDLFLVGAWSDVVELAFDIQTCFEHFTCHNPDVTLSGGVVVRQPNFPLYLTASEAKEAEENAKSNLDKCDNKCAKYEDRFNCVLFREGKNSDEHKCNRKSSVALFYSSELEHRANKLEEEYLERSDKERIAQAIKWDKARNYHILPIVEKFHSLKKNIKNNVLELDIPRSVISKLFAIIEQWRDEPEGYLYILNLVYQRSRILANLGDGKKKCIMDKILKEYMSYGENKIKYLHIPLTWVEFLIRQKGEK